MPFSSIPDAVYYYKDEVVVTCDYGYYIRDDSDTAICLADGTWDFYSICEGKHTLIVHLLFVLILSKYS